METLGAHVSTFTVKTNAAFTSEVALDLKFFRHYDGQGRKNSLIIYYYSSFNFHILAIITHLIASIFVLIFIFNNEPTWWAYRYMYLFIYDENKTVRHFHVQHHSDSGGHYKQQNMLGLGKKKNEFSILDSHFYEPINYEIPIDAVFSWWMNCTDAPSIQ